MHRHHREKIGSSLEPPEVPNSALGKEHSQHQDVMGTPGWKAALQERPQRSWWARRQKPDLAVRNADIPWAALGMLPVK